MEVLENKNKTKQNKIHAEREATDEQRTSLMGLSENAVREGTELVMFLLTKYIHNLQGWIMHLGQVSECLVHTPRLH